MTSEPTNPAGYSARMIEGVRDSVVQVRKGGRGAGAGVVWSEDGLVLTNHHVVAGRRRRVQVVLRDGQTLDAEVLKRGRSVDLALLRIQGGAGDLPAAPVGDSDALRVGELVFAVGHPWGRLGTVTAGIVSELGAARGSGGKARYIQSDVSLAPGNSGGPLLNAGGEVVGINAMISGGMAFAIPSNAASAWLAGSSEHRPLLGIRVLPVELRREDRTGETGLVIAAVQRDGLADRASLLVGDVLLGVAGETIEDAGSLLDALSRARGAVRLSLSRGGVTFEVDVDLGARGRAA